MFFLLLVAGLLAIGARGQISSYDNMTTHQLVKRDPSYVQASRAFQNCVLINPHYHKKHGGKKFCNSRIQMGECHVNSRVMNQVFAIFIPDSRDPYFGQGGVYGDCCAFDLYPEEGNLAEWENPNYACFTWEGSDKQQGKGPPKLPRTEMQPFPIVCPSNLHPCYSDHVYDDSSKEMGLYINKKVTFTGLWNPPKAAGRNGKELWCHWIGGGCRTGTLRDYTLRFIHNLKCNVDSCKPYTQSTKVVDYSAVFDIGTYPPVSDFAFYANGGIIKGKSGHQSGGGGASSGNEGGGRTGNGEGGEGGANGNNGQGQKGNGKGRDNGSGSENGNGSGNGNGNFTSGSSHGSSSDKGSGGKEDCEPKHQKSHGKKCKDCHGKEKDGAANASSSGYAELQRRGSGSSQGCNDKVQDQAAKRDILDHHRTFKRHIVKQYDLRKF